LGAKDHTIFIKNINFAAPWTLPPGATPPLTPTNYALETTPTAFNMYDEYF
jgi:hypothetical protein